MGGYRMSEVIVITSGKGGVGKTTLCANLGAAFARMEKKCVVVDTDLGLRNLDVVMGLENRIVYNLIDVAEGNCRLKQALVRDKHYPGLYLLPAAQTRDKSSITPQQLIKLTDDLRAHFEYILIDCPAGIEQGFQNAVAPADRAIVVTTPEVSAIRDADRIIGLLEAAQMKKTEMVINRIRPAMVARGEMMSVVDVTEIPEAQFMDRVVLVGTDGEDHISVEELAELSGRFNYEFVCCLSKRVPRTYISRGEVVEQTDYFS